MIPSSDPGPFEEIRQKIEASEPLSFEDGVRLFQSNDLSSLGALAEIVRRRLHQNRVFYSVNLHLNYTNICETRCSFCAFSRDANDSDAYLLDFDHIRGLVQKALDRHTINEVHIVGGHYSGLSVEYFIGMLRMIRQLGPHLFIKAFSATEIDFIAQREGMSYQEILQRFQEAGLNGLPGGGAEIFAPSIREQICPRKIDAETWLEIHRVAHRLGLCTNATMLYGHIEKAEDRVDHILRLRRLQDETKGFRAFIPLAYCAEGTSLTGGEECGGYLDLKVLAISRLLFHNVPHLKIHWPTTGLKMAQAALSFGVDDLGGTHLDEKVIHEAGFDGPRDLGKDALEHLIRSAGYEPCCVDSSYGSMDRGPGARVQIAR